MKYLALIAVLLGLAGQSWADTGRVKVVHHGPEAGLAADFESRAGRLLADMEERFGLSSGGAVTIVLASSNEEFRLAQPEGGDIPVWASGVAYPRLNLIIIKTRRAGPGLEPEVTLAHEITHLVLARAFGTRLVPTWLNEGLTMHLAHDWGVSRHVVMARAVASKRIIPLDELVSGFPSDRMGAETAYAQSFYFITFLRTRYGPEIIGGIVRNLALGVSVENTFMQASGSRLDVLEEEFNRWLSHRFSIIWLVTGSGAIWFLAAIMIVAAWVRKKRESALKLAAWEAEEDGDERTVGRSGRFGRTSRRKNPL